MWMPCANVGNNNNNNHRSKITLELSQIWWSNSPGLVPVGTTAATLDVNWSNVLNWVSLSKAFILRSSKDKALTPHSPPTRRFHVVSTPQPSGVTMPSPKRSSKWNVQWSEVRERELVSSYQWQLLFGKKQPEEEENLKRKWFGKRNWRVFWSALLAYKNLKLEFPNPWFLSTFNGAERNMNKTVRIKGPFVFFRFGWWCSVSLTYDPCSG